MAFLESLMFLLASIAAVYLLARIIFAAYFAAKAAFLRRFFNGSDS